MADAAGPAVPAPPSDERVSTWIGALRVAPGRHVLDLGCGAGELLLRLVATNPATTGTGVDSSAPALERGRRAAVERRLADRVEFVHGDPAEFDDVGSLVVALRAGALWGSPSAWLDAIKARLEPGGLALAGGRLPDGGIAELAAIAEQHGFRVILAEEATPAELAAQAESDGYGYVLLSPL